MTPTTEAGRRLLHFLHEARFATDPEHDECDLAANGLVSGIPGIAAIEAEARKAALVEHRCDALAAGRVAGAADLARKIEARVAAIVRVGVGAAEPSLVPLAAVLAIIREEAER